MFLETEFTHAIGKVFMTPEERFRFDLQGFLVVKGVLSSEEDDSVDGGA
jgi:hypothetical protein